MSKFQKVVKTCDRSDLQSLELGILVVLLTGCVHYFIMASCHFDFLIFDAEFMLMAGAVLLILALTVVDFNVSLYAMRRMNTPHSRFAKPEAIAGIALGLAMLLPALILLAIMIETQLLRFVQLQKLFEF